MKQFLMFWLAMWAITASAQPMYRLDSLFNWQDEVLPPSTAHFNTYNEVWGYARGGREYAIIGTTMGTHIFDVTDPAMSEEVEFIEGAATGPQIVHRDYHDFEDHLYMVSDEGASTLQIADLSFLPDSAPVVYDSNELFARCHNIFIDSSSARMYLCGGPLQFAVYSLEELAEPELLIHAPSDVPFWSNIGYVHDAFVRGDTAYLNTEWRGLFVVDFSDLSDVRMIGSLDSYTQSGYNHSGWLMQDAPYYAMADETHGMDLKIVDVSDMENLTVTDTIGSDVHEFSIVHNALYRDDLLFVSHYVDGLYVFECSDPAHPQLAGVFDTSDEPHVNNWYRGCWGVYPFLPSGNVLVSDMQTGLWVLGMQNVLSTGETAAVDRPLQIYPNPVKNQLTISPELRDADYSLMDMMGRSVGQGELGSDQRVDLSDLPHGVYILTLRHQDGHDAIRVVKD